MGELKKANYPLSERNQQFQAETGSPEGYKVADVQMPTITLVAKTQGIIKEITPVTIKPLRESYDVNPGNPEASMKDQFVKPNEFEHSPGAFNN